MKVITTNKVANFEYFVLDRFVAGLVLKGCEVKSIRAGSVSINDSYVQVRDGQAWVINMFVKTYSHTSNYAPDEKCNRKLLLNKSEIAELQSAITQKGLTIVPLKLYFEGNLAKLEIAICKGKQLHDKKRTIKERDIARDAYREIKNSK